MMKFRKYTGAAQQQVRGELDQYFRMGAVSISILDDRGASGGYIVEIETDDPEHELRLESMDYKMVERAPTPGERWHVYCLDDEGEEVRATLRSFPTRESAAFYASTVAPSRKPVVRKKG